jgi:hypothetical protein
MSSIFSKCLSVLSAYALLSAPSMAQTFNGTESQYASVKGWQVASYSDASGAFNSCGAVKFENGNKVMLGLGADGSWGIAVPTTQTGTFGGGILDIDKVSIDSQFGFVGGFAIRDLSNQEVRMIKAGRQLGVVVNGDGPEKWFSLTGSTAAILKTTECVQRRGQIKASAPAATSAKSNGGSVFSNQTAQVGQTAVGNCESGFGGAYRCTLEKLPTKAGYRSSTRVTDTSNSVPVLDLDEVSPNEADVWANMNGTWLFMGRWSASNSSGNCLSPVSNQVAEARNNLGQDAWSLCVN